MAKSSQARDTAPARTSAKQTEKLVTRTATFHPIIGCLEMIEKQLGTKPSQWRTPVGGGARSIEQQKQLLALTTPARADLSKMSEQEFKSRASKLVKEINGFLKEEGFDIQLQEINDPTAFYVASVLKVGVEWVLEAKKRALKVSNASYPGVYIEDAAVWNSPNHQHPIVCLDAKNGDKVYMTIADRQLEGPAMLEHLKGLSGSTTMPLQYAREFEGVHFPMIQYDEEVDISWIQGMLTNVGKQDWKIAEAKQQTKFRMNEKGAKVESAAAMGIVACSARMPTQPVIIDQPFFLWMVRDGMVLPYFSALLAETHWSEPESVD